MIRLLLSLVLLSLGTALPAQVVLQLERFGSAKTRKFYEGQSLMYRMPNDKTWYQSEIVRLIPEDRIVVFDQRYLPMNDIRAIRSDHPQRWSKPVAYNLYIFGSSWSFFSFAASLAYKDYSYSGRDALITGTSLATGFLIHKLFRYRTWKMDQRHRLRMLDLRMGPNW
jgi:hypothetical protein